MAGRVTYLQDGAENEGGWEPLTRSERTRTEIALGRNLTDDEIASLVTLKNGTRIGIEKAINRKLTDDEVALIEKNIAPILQLKISFIDPTSQDIKKSLANIGKLPPDKALAAYKRSDSTTTGLIDEALVLSLGIDSTSLRFRQPQGDDIALAAKHALEEISNGKSGRPKLFPYRESLAQLARAFWEQFKPENSSSKAWHRGDKTSPIVNFMKSFALVIGDVLDADTSAKLLRAANKKPLLKIAKEAPLKIICRINPK